MLIYQHHVADDQPCLRIFFCRFGQLAKYAGVIGIVRVLPCDPFACCPTKALVYGFRLPTIRFAYPPCQPIRIATNDVNATVGRTAIDDEVLQVRVVLVKNGANRAFQIACLVITRRDDSDAWPLRHFVLPGSLLACRR